MENEEQKVVVNSEPVATKKSSGIGKFFIFGFLGILVVALLVGTGIAYAQINKLSENKLVLGVAKVLSVPAAKINGLNITYVDYIDDLQTMRSFYANPPAGITKPSDEVISDQVLSRLVANRLIQSLAKKYDAKVTDEDREQFKTDLLAQFTDENEAVQKINEYYGWTLDKYLKKVGEPILLEQKLQEVIAGQQDFFDGKYATTEVNARHILFLTGAEKSDAEVKKQAEEVLQKIKDGADFVEMAKEYGSDSTKDSGGDLGWFGQGMMVPEFEEAAFSLEPGTLSPELVQTQYGYHILQVMEKRQTQDFIAFMNDQLQQAKIEVLLPIHDPFAQLQQTLEAGDLEVETETVQ